MPEPQLPFETYAREVLEVPVSDEMSESFLAYSLSVITARAIPDVRDGLKPVQRRILYSMQQMGLRPDRPHRKCAHVVGDTMARFHPHGDGAIYETLVRMAQPFGRQITFVDPQGNFGSLDDPPAAYRYTECRLTDAAMDMLRELDEDTVEMRATYDGETSEPVVLPALLPNLLVNGTSGIAVGMATNMVPHNLREIAAAIELVMAKRRGHPRVDELLEVVPGPDLPGGGIVIDDTLAEAYATGRGSVRVRARIEVERLTRSRHALVVTELPYLVGAERVIAKIQELVRDGRLTEVADVKNLSDRQHGLRIQIELKGGADVDRVLSELYRQTPLEESFGINNVVLVDGVPTTLGLADLCRHYVEHRLDVVVRRTRYRLARAQERLHIVEGYLIALDDIDLVISLVRASQDRGEARAKLMDELALSEIQANHILDMTIAKLVALERLNLEEERDELQARIGDYEALLASERRQRRVVRDELREVVELYGTDRRSEVVAANALPAYQPPATDEEPTDDEACVVTLTTTNKVGRSPVSGTRRVSAGRDDVIAARSLASLFSPVLAITSAGRALRVQGSDLDEVTGRSRGADAGRRFGANKGERVLTVLSPGTEPLVVVTANGLAKRIAPDALAALRHGRPVIKLKPNDQLVAAFSAPDGADLVLVAADAQSLRTPVDDVSLQGPGAAGVAAMSTRSAGVVGGGAVLGEEVVATVTSAGAAKATPAGEIAVRRRGATGVRLTRLGEGHRIVAVAVAPFEHLWAQMATDRDASQLDPVPIPFPVQPTRRDLASATLDRAVLAVGTSRW